MTRCYLEPANVFAERGLDTLRLWLAGFILRDDIFSHPPPRLCDLHSALMCAVMELKLRLDPQLEYAVNTGTEGHYGMEFDPESFWVERRFNTEIFEEMREPGIRALDRETTMKYLEEARAEIEWVRNETRRFELHLDNAHRLIVQKLRRRFVYRITPRQAPQHSLVPDVVEDGVQVKEDEEMLDDDSMVERRTRSRTPEPGEVSRYDDDYDLSEGEVSDEASLGDGDEGKENRLEDDEDFKAKKGGKRKDSVAAKSWGVLRL